MTSEKYKRASDQAKKKNDVTALVKKLLFTSKRCGKGRHGNKLCNGRESKDQILHIIVEVLKQWTKLLVPSLT